MNTKAAGSALIGFGLMMLLIRIFDIQVDLTLFLIGGCFITVYFTAGSSRKRNIGFLIPGSILLALGLMELLNDLPVIEKYDDLLFFGCLALAFIAIRIIGGIYGNQVKWASIVAIALIGFDIFLVIVEYSSVIDQYGDWILPFVFIALGVIFVMSTVFSNLKKNRY